MNPALKKWASIGERAAVAFIGGFLTAFAGITIRSSDVTNKSWWFAIGTAGIAGGLTALVTFIISLVGTNIGNPNTPSTLPASLDPAGSGKGIKVGTGYIDVVPRFVTGNTNSNSAWLPPAEIGERVKSSHPTKKLGRRPASNAPSLRFLEHLVAVPPHPIADPAPNLSWPMDHNDTVGDCVVACGDHALQAIYTSLTGHYTNWTDAQMLALYQTQNPSFKSWSQGGTDADGGMDIQTFLNYLVKTKVILGFAKVDHTNLDEVKAATWLGLGLVTGEILTSKNMSEQVWDYHAGDTEEGGHCTVNVGYDPLDHQVSWGALYSMTDAFFQKRVEEAWFVITQAHVDNAAFRAGFDLASFAAAYKAITGKDFPVAVTPPAPSPTPVPVPVPTPTPSPTPDAGFQAALDAVPGLDKKLLANAPKHKNPDGSPMSEAQYLAWLAAGALNLR